jgi:hypothetical protein
MLEARTAAWYRLRAELRTGGWTFVAGMVVLLGAVGGSVLVAAAGARRTASAFERLEDQTKAATVLVNPDDWTKVSPSVLRHLPGVQAASVSVGLMVMPSHMTHPLSSLAFLADTGSGFGTVDQPVVRAGRLPRASRPEEVFANPAGARALHLRVGDEMDLRVVSPAELGPYEQDPTAMLAATQAGRIGTERHVRLVGIGDTTGDVVPGATLPTVVLTRAFLRSARVEPVYGGIAVRLAGGTAAAGRFVQAARQRFASQKIDFQTLAADRDTVHRAVTPDVIALSCFAAVLLLGAMASIGQPFGRRAAQEARDGETLAALGMPRADRRTVDWLRLGLVLGGGVLLAVVVAVVASGTMPPGVAGQVEPHPGIAPDWVVLAPGAVILLLAVGGSAVAATMRARRPVARAARPSRVGRWIRTTSGARPVSLGARLAVQPRGRAGGPPPVAVAVTAAAAVLLVVGSLTFAASLRRFVATPSAYGYAFDAIVRVSDLSPGQEAPSGSALTKVLSKEHTVAAASQLFTGQVHLHSGIVPGYGLRAGVRGHAAPTLIEGRLPTTDDEIALGATTMRAEGVGLGDRLVVTGPAGRPLAERVVGRVVLPGIADYAGSDQAALGVGALLSADGLARATGVADPPETLPAAELVDLRAGATLASLRAAVTRSFGPDTLVTQGPGTPADVTSVQRVRSAPLVLAGLFAALGAVMVGNGLVVAVRRQRLDLAVLRTLGIAPRTVRAVVASQATTIAAIAAIVGIPVGVVVGRLAWSALSRQLGIVPTLDVPWVELVCAAVGVLVVANLMVLIPAHRSARAPLAEVLRAE